MTIRRPKAHARQISVYQGQTHAFGPRYQGNLKEKRTDHKTYCYGSTKSCTVIGWLGCSLSYLLPKLGTNCDLHKTESPENPKVTFRVEERFDQARERFCYNLPSAFMSIQSSSVPRAHYEHEHGYLIWTRSLIIDCFCSFQSTRVTFLTCRAVNAYPSWLVFSIVSDWRDIMA